MILEGDDGLGKVSYLTTLPSQKLSRLNDLLKLVFCFLFLFFFLGGFKIQFPFKQERMKQRSLVKDAMLENAE